MREQNESGPMVTIRAPLVAAIALFAVSLSAQGRSTDLQQRYPFTIPSESLDAALMTFSAQSGIRVGTSGLPANVLSAGAAGDLSALDALTALLRGTGLSFRQVASDTIVVVPAQIAQLRPTQFDLLGNVTKASVLADQPAAAAAPAASATTQLTEVQVTGTRIVREGYEAPTPVTAVGLQQLQDTAQANMGDALEQMPQFQGNENFTTQERSDPESVQTEVNLRNLSASRTLVLFDGRRLPSANTEDVPDLDLVPDALVQRIDVVTGGASAVYGSDAVAGVVNYVLDTNFSGIKGLVQGGISGYGDTQSEKISLTFGTTFAGGRLHFLVSGDERYQAELPGTARPWDTQQLGESLINDPAYVAHKNTPQYIFEPCCVAEPGFYQGGLILSGPLQGTAFGAGGTPFQYNYGVPVNTPLGPMPGLTTAGNGILGGDWQITNTNTDIDAGTQDTHFFARVGFDITPTVQIFAQWLEGTDHTKDECCNNYYPTGIGTLYTSNPYLPASTAAQAAAAGVTSFSVGESINSNINGDFENGPGMKGAIPVCVCVDDYRVTDVYVLGLKGQLTIGKNTYNWNVYGQQGYNLENFAIGDESNKTNLSNAIQAVRVGSYGPNNSYTDLNGKTLVGYTAANYPNPLGIPTGTTTCLSNLLPLNNPNETNNCVPYNVFGLGVASQAALNYTNGLSIEREVEQQSILGGSITGEPFSDWAGPVSVALDAEYRHEAASGFNDPISEQTDWFSANLFPYFGSLEVTEGALETVVPLLKGLPGVQELDANAGARATDYSTSGYVTTYKYGFEYTPINDLRFRATESFDIRAPNLGNLFGYTTGHGNTVDPFQNNASAPAYNITGGNPNLKAEKAHQYEIGLVFQPSELPGLNISVDYYHIKIDSAIGSLSNTFELQSCYNTRIPGTFTGTSPLCALVVRTPCTPCPGTAGEPAGSLYSVETIPFNIASFLASGVDYSFDYRKQLTEIVSSWKGAFDFHLTATNTIHDITNTGLPSPSEILDATGTGSVPRWAVFATLTYDLDAWRLSWTERYDSSVLSTNTDIVCQTNCPNPIPTGFTTINVEPRVPAYFLAGFTATYKFMEHDQQEAEAFINVNNVFNKNPYFGYSAVLSNGNAVNTGLYDAIGLYVNAGIRFRL